MIIILKKIVLIIIIIIIKYNLKKNFYQKIIIKLISTAL